MSNPFSYEQIHQSEAKMTRLKECIEKITEMMVQKENEHERKLNEVLEASDEEDDKVENRDNMDESKREEEQNY